MAIDEIAERVVDERLAAAGDIAFYSEDRGLVEFGQPRAILVIDPVDGTRPAAAGLESCCVSIAVVPPTEDATLGDVVVRRRARAQDRRSGSRRGAARARVRRRRRLAARRSRRRRTPTCDALFWTAGLRGRPSLPMSVVLEELVDGVGHARRLLRPRLGDVQHDA